MAQAGYTPIQLYYSTTASAAPSSGNLANGELAINITDGKLYYKDNGGTVRVLAGTGGTGVVAGSNTQVQFNNNGVFGASSGLTFDGTTLTANALTVTNATTLSAGTANGVAYLNGSKVLTTGSALTFDGTALQTSAARGTYSLKVYNSSDGSVAGNFGALTGNVFAIDATGPANTMTFLTGGTEGMRLTSTGLGIGTSSPSELLSVAGNATAHVYKLRTNASAPSSTDAFIYRPADNTLGFGTNSTECARINSQGIFCLGTTGTINDWNNSLVKMRVTNGIQFGDYSAIAEDFFDADSLGIAVDSTESLIFGQYTINTKTYTERGRFTAAGNFALGNTDTQGFGATYKFWVDGTYGATITSTGGAGYEPLNLWNQASSGSRVQIYFRDGGAGSVRGSISTDGANTAYNTSSDYRLKDNPAPLSGSGDFIDALQPKTWTWKTNGARGVGFIAHEAQKVSPSSVVGEKDAVGKDGNPIYQAMEYGSAEFIANIIAELQSLRKRVAQLEQGA